MRKRYLFFCVLIIVLFVFGGCRIGSKKTDLSEYHQSGESWSISYNESEYNISYVSRNGNTMLIDLEIIANPVNSDKIYVYSKGYQVIYNGEFCYESVFVMPMFIPVGYYELPIVENRVSFEIITEKEDFNGYVKITLENLPSYNGPVQAIRFNVY